MAKLTKRKGSGHRTKEEVTSFPRPEAAAAVVAEARPRLQETIEA